MGVNGSKAHNYGEGGWVLQMMPIRTTYGFFSDWGKTRLFEDCTGLENETADNHVTSITEINARVIPTINQYGKQGGVGVDSNGNISYNSGSGYTYIIDAGPDYGKVASYKITNQFNYTRNYNRYYRNLNTDITNVGVATSTGETLKSSVIKLKDSRYNDAYYLWVEGNGLSKDTVLTFAMCIGGETIPTQYAIINGVGFGTGSGGIKYEESYGTEPTSPRTVVNGVIYFSAAVAVVSVTGALVSQPTFYTPEGLGTLALGYGLISAATIASVNANNRNYDNAPPPIRS